VIPLFIEGARMPGAAELPERLRGLEHRNGLPLDTASWPSDLEALLGALRTIGSVTAKESPPGGGDSRDSPDRGTSETNVEDDALPRPTRWRRRNVLLTAALVILAGSIITIVNLARDGSEGDSGSPSLRVKPASGPSGTTIEVSGNPCPPLPDGLVPDAIYVGLHDQRREGTADENPAEGSAALRPGESWQAKIELPDGTPPGQYRVYASCFGIDPKEPSGASRPFYLFPDDQFEVAPS